MVRLGASTFPLPDTGPLRRLQVGTDIFFYNKFDADAPIDEVTFDQSYLGWEPGSLPETERAAAENLALPMWGGIDVEQQARVVAAVRAAVGVAV